MKPFIIIPPELLTDNLTLCELKVMISLYSFRNKSTNLCSPSIKEIAIRCSINDIVKISKVTTSLEQKGLLKKSKPNFRGPNTYELQIPAELIELESIIDQ